MAALTRGIAVSVTGVSGYQNTMSPALPVKGGVKIYHGASVMMDSAGFVRPAAPLAGARGIGIYDASPATPGGNQGNPLSTTFDTTGKADGEVSISNIRYNITVLRANSSTDPVTMADFGNLVYAEDDHTIARTVGTNRPVMGRLYKVDAQGARIVIGAV